MYEEDREEELSLTEDTFNTPRVKNRYDVVFGDDEDQEVEDEESDIFDDPGFGFQASPDEDEDEGADIN